MAHALLSPSSAERWMACPGSVAMSLQSPASTSKYADEGTVAHHIAAECLRANYADAAAYKGRRYEVVNGAVHLGGPRPPKLRGHSTDVCTMHEVDAEMVAAVNKYVGQIKCYAVGADGVWIEEAISIEHITDEIGAEGTADAVILKGGILQIHDLKYGQGVKVSASTPQLKMYALGVMRLLDLLELPYTEVRCYIHQPRVFDDASWVAYAPSELLEFMGEVRAKADIALAILDAGDVGAELHPGEGQCHFCAAKTRCPALTRKVETAVFDDFEIVNLPGAAPKEIVAAAKSAVTKPTDNADWLSKSLAVVGLIEEWCKSVRDEAYRRLSAGLPLPMYKLVQGKGGARRWASEAEAEAALKALRLKVEEMYDKKVISPTSAEKLLKDAPKKWEKLQPLIVKAEGKPTIAEESDPRPAIVVGDPADDFTTQGEDLI